MTRQQLAASVAAITDPERLHRELIDCNGTVQNMAVRRMTTEQLRALLVVAEAAPRILGLHGPIFHATRGELRRRGI